MADPTPIQTALTAYTQQVNAEIAAKDKQIADLTAQLEAAKPPASTMQYGVSATPSPWTTNYPLQVKTLNATCAYFYGQAFRWSQLGTVVPDDHDLFIQTKATTRADYDTMLAGFPRQRTGKVFLHHWNEPEDQVERGDFTLETWQSRQDALFAAIDAAGLPYVVKSVELMWWTQQLTAKGGASPARTVSNYLRPGTQHVGWSAYAQKKTVNGHEVATYDATVAAAMKAWADKTGLSFSVISGWAIATALVNDPITLENRRTWLSKYAPAMAAAGCKHFMWFDIPWADGDYRIASDPGLLTVWRSLAD